MRNTGNLRSKGTLPPAVPINPITHPVHAICSSARNGLFSCGRGERNDPATHLPQVQVARERVSGKQKQNSLVREEIVSATITIGIQQPNAITQNTIKVSAAFTDTRGSEEEG